jgi:hypothetical protein
MVREEVTAEPKTRISPRNGIAKDIRGKNFSGIILMVFAKELRLGTV